MNKETIEEAAERLYPYRDDRALKRTFKHGAKSDAAKDYWFKKFQGQFQSIVPFDAYNIEVFKIGNDENGKLFAYIGFRISNGNFHFNVVPFTEPQQETLEEAALRQLFKNRSNCYADTGIFENDGSYSEGEIIQSMDEDCFINTIKEYLQEQDNSKYSKNDLEVAFFEGRENKLSFVEWFLKFKKK
jgi:hypothetical protein